eukprot:CAMPEP_0185834730 /NCGR_PEP_ID=MMETSP1353-20130828/6075_1 /TAXON_ID=1077150 /ORGANISM="Erythrolobus australicus, Strain CCMP3124" /LENGTH=112 /DNA_ID=CAMNT_0028533223 /DNA_START=215 /DNA_END=553 /DNA_ORIENTATION=-
MPLLTRMELPNALPSLAIAADENNALGERGRTRERNFSRASTRRRHAPVRSSKCKAFRNCSRSPSPRTDSRTSLPSVTRASSTFTTEQQLSTSEALALGSTEYVPAQAKLSE